MPTFATGRTRPVTITGKVRVRLYARYFPIPMGRAQEIGNASYGYFAWPGPELQSANFASVQLAFVTLMGGQPGYRVTLKLGANTETVDVAGGGGSGGYDFTANVPFTPTATLQEMKSVTDLGTYPGGIQDFTTETHLDYFERFTGQATLSAGGQSVQANLTNELHWSNGYKITLHGEDHRRVTWNNGNPYQPYTYNSQINSTPQEPSVLVSAEASFSPLYHTNAERTCSSGWWHGKVERLTSPPVDSRLYFDNPQVSLTGTLGAGFEVTAKSRLEAAPKLIWDLDGNLRQWDENYAGVIVDDLSNANTMQSEPDGRVTRHYEAERFSWFITDNWNHGDLIETTVNQLGPDKYRLYAGWITANEEDADDWRIVLDDDVSVDAFLIKHLSSFVLDDFTSGWDAMPSAGSANVSYSSNVMQVEVLEPGASVSKTISRRLSNYRYLQVTLKTDNELIPVRVSMGDRYWDVLIEQADTSTTKTIDLCAPHNAASFADISGSGDIPYMEFSELAEGANYWFSELRLIRQAEAIINVLPQFLGSKRIFTGEVDKRGSIAEAYSQSIVALIDRIAPGGIGSGLEVTPQSSGHSYYNNNLTAAYLTIAPFAFDRSIISDTMIKAHPRYDLIRMFPGIGDPAQPTYSGSFVAKFTKIIHAKVDGLVYIRDTSRTDFTTRVRIRKGTTDLEIIRTTAERYYRSAHQKPGDYETSRLDEADQVWMPATTALHNRFVSRRDLRAQILRTEDGTPIPDAIASVERLIGLISGEDYSYYERSVGITNSNGLYAVSCIFGSNWDFYVFEANRCMYRLPTVVLAGGEVLDIAQKIVSAGKTSGRITKTGTSQGLAASVFANETQHDEKGWGVTDADGQGNYLIAGLVNTAAEPRPYSVFADATGYSAGRLINVTVTPGQETANQNLSLSETGGLTGQVVNQNTQPLAAIVYAFQTDSLKIGFGAATTDVNGNYTITDLDAVMYDIFAEADGYAKGSALNIAVPSGAPTTRNFVLTP